MEKPIIRLSKSRKGVIVFIGDQMWFTSVKSMKKVLDGSIPYTILKKTEPSREVGQTWLPSVRTVKKEVEGN